MAEKILLIDDDSTVSRALKMLLHKSGYDVTIADNGRKALDIIKENRFDLIVSDIRMPGMSGIETLRKLRDKEKEGDKITPAVIITGYAGEGQYFPDETLGVTDYLYKPFENEEFLKMVKKVLGSVSKPVKEEIYPGLKINFPIGIPSLERKKFKYSEAFTRFEEKNLDLLMDELLKSSTDFITKDLKDENLKKKVSEFWGISFKNFLKGLNQLDKEIQADAKIDEKKFLHFKKMTDDFIKRGDDLTRQIDNKKTTREMKKIFRRLGGEWFYQSEIVMKGFKKVRGYPGDFEMMNFVYDNRIVSDAKIAVYFEKYFLNNPYAAGVRGRKNKMVKILERHFKLLKDEGRSFRVLNLACGPSREIQELFSKGLNIKSKVDYICLDLDKEALDFSKQALNNIPDNVKMRFLQENILELLKNPEDYQAKLGNCDIVYSIGLADYLPDKIMRKMINACFSFLKPQGLLMLAFKITERDPFAPVPPDWFCDWKFVPRSEDDVEQLIATSNIENYSISKEWEETGKIEYFLIKKKG